MRSLLNPRENQARTVNAVLHFINSTGLYIWKLECSKICILTLTCEGQQCAAKHRACRKVRRRRRRRKKKDGGTRFLLGIQSACALLPLSMLRPIPSHFHVSSYQKCLSSCPYDLAITTCPPRRRNTAEGVGLQSSACGYLTPVPTDRSEFPKRWEKLLLTRKGELTELSYQHLLLLESRRFFDNVAMSWRKTGIDAVLIAIYMVLPIAAGDEEPVLFGTEGEDISLPDKLNGSGSLRWCSPPSVCQTYLRVQDGDVMKILPKVSWIRSTGEIVVKNLQQNDTGKLILEMKNYKPITYNLLISTRDGRWWLPLVLVLVVVLVVVVVLLVLVFGLGFRFGPCKKTIIPPRSNGGSVEGSAQTVNGYEKGHPMKKKEDSPV